MTFGRNPMKDYSSDNGKFYCFPVRAIYLTFFMRSIIDAANSTLPSIHNGKKNLNFSHCKHIKMDTYRDDKNSIQRKGVLTYGVIIPIPNKCTETLCSIVGFLLKRGKPTLGR
ncbi:hypothetical protein CEXT_360961 [Caerostris extrusa]|uniref:Uncharacterized protein n=1 Tax=Caerostris extrusa TaxID=172846 RepID=A0AAV4NWC1_CAEEX|nr:hypothetical protein CEXT_360961 [Caerostris extrusa]